MDRSEYRSTRNGCQTGAAEALIDALPLRGVRVLELAWNLPGPYCGQVLADLGADVIKVEPPEAGDSLRVLMPAMFAQVNRHKRSLALDLKAPHAQEVITRLLRTADALIEGFRPGVADRLGVGPERARTLNPAIVYCSISGFGQTGPWRARSGHDINYAALSGLIGRASQRPTVPSELPVPVGDLASGALATISILAGLIARQRVGTGQAWDVSIADVLLSWSVPKGAECLATGELPAVAELELPTHAVYRTRDGRHLSVGAVEDHFWHALCRVIGRADWLERPELETSTGRARHHDEPAAGLRRAFAAHDCDDLLARLEAADVPAARVLDLPEALQSEQVHARGVAVAAPDGRGLQVPFPPRVAGARLRGPGRAPALGAHNDEILAELGMPAAPASSH